MLLCISYLISVIGLWSREEGVKTKVQYINRKCTLCNGNDIHDEDYIV